MRAATCSSAPPCSKGFQAFWASSACAASATSVHLSGLVDTIVAAYAAALKGGMTVRLRTCAIWARAAAITAGHDCSNSKGCARTQATGADLVCEVFSLLWSRPTTCNGSSRQPSPTNPGRPTSPTSVRTKAGCTWPSWWTCSHARWWAGPWAAASTRLWSLMRC